MVKTPWMLGKQPKPYGTVSLVPDTDGLDRVIPQLTTYGRKGKNKINIGIHGKYLPDELVLRVKPVQVPLENIPISIAQFVLDGERWKSCNIYQKESVRQDHQQIYKNSLFSKIDFIFEGTAFLRKKGQLLPFSGQNDFSFGLNLCAGSIIGTRKFLVAESSTFTLEQTIYKLKHSIVRMHPGISGMDIIPLIPFAGYIPSAMDLSSACQAYAQVIDGGRKQTMIGLYTQLDLLRKGIRLSSPSHPTRFQFAGSMESAGIAQLTVGAWIMAGYLEVVLDLGDPEDAVRFYSARYTVVDPGTGVMDVIFLRRKDKK